MYVSRPLSLTLLSFVALAAACGQGRDEGDEAVSVLSRGAPSARGSGVAGGPSFVEEDGAVSMRSTDGAFVMRLRSDSVLVAFSDSMRATVMAHVDSSMEADVERDPSAISGMVQGIVHRTVRSSLREVFEKERGFSVTDLSGVRYENGSIHFEYRRKPNLLIDIEKIESSDEPLLSSFHPADAARFVGAVRSRIDTTP